jgi:hypothetical protein
MAACLEESRLTGVHDRLIARRARLMLEVIGSVWELVSPGGGERGELKRKALELGQWWVPGQRKSPGSWEDKDSPRGGEEK